MTTHSLISYYQQIDDPRQQSKCHYNLEEVLFMVTSAILCGAEDWEMIAEFVPASWKPSALAGNGGWRMR
jgi:hypothetical protein